jgi:hypothetical protein
MCPSKERFMADHAKPLVDLEKQFEKTESDWIKKQFQFKLLIRKINVKNNPSDVDKIAVMAEKWRIEMANTLMALATLKATVAAVNAKVRKALTDLSEADGHYD